MPPRRQAIYELQEKIDGLQKLTGYSDNFLAFCDHAVIKREALRACLTDNGKRGLSRTHQERLSASIGFSIKWPEWIETETARILDGTRRDTAALFLRRCRRELFPNAEPKPDADRQQNLALRSVRTAPPRYVDDQLATVELQASQSGPGQPWPISADIICNPSFVAAVEVAVKRGRLKMDCGEARADTRSNPPPAGGHVIKRETGSVTLRPGGDSQRPSLEIEASTGPIGVISLPFDFWMIHDLAPGDALKVRFLVYLMDMEPVEPSELDEPREDSPGADSLSFIRVGFKKLGPAKQKVLKRIAEMQLPGGEDGLAVLAADELFFEAAADVARSLNSGEDHER